MWRWEKIYVHRIFAKCWEKQHQNPYMNNDSKILISNPESKRNLTPISTYIITIPL